MDKVKQDEAREYRITMEAIVDCYGPEEQAMGWYYYLQDRITSPFKARCIEERSISPLREGEEVDVKSMADEEDCEKEMFVMTEWKGRSLGMPLRILLDEDVPIPLRHESKQSSSRGEKRCCCARVSGRANVYIGPAPHRFRCTV